MATAEPVYNPPAGGSGYEPDGVTIALNDDDELQLVGGYSESQTLLAHAQDVVFSLAGFPAGTKRVRITSQGTAISGAVTLLINDNANPCTYSGIVWTSGGVPAGVTTVLAGSYNGPFDITFLDLDLLPLGGRRSGAFWAKYNN